MKILTTLIMGLTLLTGMSSLAHSIISKGSQDNKQPKVDVYYFHTSSRCVTCRTVESEAKMNVKELFGDDVRFLAVNLDDKAGEAKGKELGVNSQCLLVVSGKKKFELTNEGFLYARTNPDKFRQIMKEKIQPLL